MVWLCVSWVYTEEMFSRVDLRGVLCSWLMSGVNHVLSKKKMLIRAKKNRDQSITGCVFEATFGHLSGKRRVFVVYLWLWFMLPNLSGSIPTVQSSLSGVSGPSSCRTVFLFPPNISHFASWDNDLSSKNNVSRCGREARRNPNRLFLPWNACSLTRLTLTSHAEGGKCNDDTNTHTHKYSASIFPNIPRHTHTYTHSPQNSRLWQNSD